MLKHIADGAEVFNLLAIKVCCRMPLIQCLTGVMSLLSSGQVLCACLSDIPSIGGDLLVEAQDL